MKLRIGATLQNGKYQLNQVLGRESRGATYLATQTLLQQPVVIKTIDPSLQITQSFPQLKIRFGEEIRLLARCQHPSIVRVLDLFEEDALPFLVMEYVPGQTLHDRVSTQNAPNLTEAESIHYMRQVASALSVAHRNGLIHRNIRPETIVRRQGTNLGILVGFGLAHEIEIPGSIEQNPFAPSDQNSANRFAIDLYSLAATLHYLLTGQPPNGALSFDQYPWSPATKQALFRGLTRDPQWQPQTVDDWLRLLPNTTLPLMAANTIVQNGKTPAASSQNNGTRSREPEVTLTPFPVQNGHSATTPAKVPTPKPVAVPATATKLPTAPIQVSPITNRIRHMPKFLTLTIATAGAIGLGFGLALRISAAKSSGTSVLQPIQSFSEKEWKGTLNPSDNNLTDIPLESSSAKSSKTPQKFVDPEVDRPTYIPSPKVEPLPEYSRPIQPRTRRSPVLEPITPKPAPSVEPTDTLPESIATPSPDPAAPSITAPPAVNPAPVRPNTQEVTPTPSLDSNQGN